MSHNPAEHLAAIEADRRDRLRLAMTVSSCADLLPMLDEAAGMVLGGQYRIESLLAVGSQFFVWSATGVTTTRPVIVKQARFDYRHPVRYGRAEIERARAAVRREDEVLWADSTRTLPLSLALFTADSPVPAAATSPGLAKQELFVVEEYVRGLTLTELALRVWSEWSPAERESAVARLAREFVAFWLALRNANWFYGDIGPDNLLIDKTGRLRVVDAGSAVAAAVAGPVVLPGFTPAFTAPRLFAAASRGEPVPGVLATVLPSLGKIIHFSLTGREQLNGQLPDLSDSMLWQYSPHCRLLMELTSEVDAHPERVEDATAALMCWEESRVQGG